MEQHLLEQLSSSLEYNRNIIVSTMRIDQSVHCMVFYKGVFVRRILLGQADLDYAHVAAVEAFEAGLLHNERPAQIEQRIHAWLNSPVRRP